MNQQRQPSLNTLWRELPAPAPHLTRKHTCSDCHVEAIEAADGDMIVCPKCFNMLWHRDWSAAERERKAAAAAEAKAIRDEILKKSTLTRATNRAQRAKPVAFTAEDLILSPPTIGTPGLDRNDD